MNEIILSPLFVVFAVALVGLCVGSFLNVVIYRLPRMLERQWLAEAAELRGETLPQTERFNLALPRSHCPHCSHPISAIENIPLLSYLALRGRCKHCHTPIGLRYPFVEVLTAALSAYTAWRFGLTPTGLFVLLFVWTMILLAFIDFDTQFLPDCLNQPLLWLGLLANIEARFVPLPDAVIGAMAGYLFLWSIYWLFRLLTGKEGMGAGDFKLFAAIGAWLGWQILPLTIVLAAASGTVIGIGLIVLKRHTRGKPMPFGPFLAIAGLIALFWGKALGDALPIFALGY